MKRFKSETILTCILALTLASLVPNAFIHPSFAQTTRVYLDRSNNTFPEGTPASTKFNVTVMIADATNVSGADVYIEFEDDALNVTRWFVPTANSSFIFYNQVLFIAPTPPNDVNYHHQPQTNVAYIKLAVSQDPMTPDQPAFYGNGVICIVEFNITKPAPPQRSTYISLTHVYPTFTLYTYLLNGDGVELPDVNLESSSYTLIPEITPVLGLSVLMVSTIAVLLLRKRQLVQRPTKT